MKKCIYCAEEIQDEAILCRYCGRDIYSQKEKISPFSNSWKHILLFFGSIILVFMYFAPIWSSQDQIFHYIFQRVASITCTRIDCGQAEFEAISLYTDKFEHFYFTISTLQIIPMIGLAILSIFDLILFVKKSRYSTSKLVWILVCILLLVFPINNLFLSWNLFLQPGVIYSIIIIVYAIYIKFRSSPVQS